MRKDSSLLQAHIPMLELHTPRMTVAPVASDDLGAVLAMMSHPSVRDGLCWAGASPTEASLRQRPYYAARLSADGRLAGALGLHDQLMSVCVAPDCWRLGLGAELVQLACDVLAPAAGFDRIGALVLRSNVASQRLFESAGFHFDGLIQPPGRGAGAVLRYVFRLNIHTP